MKKKLTISFLVLLLTSLLFGKEIHEISDERAIILVNYLQYSLTQIREHPDNKIVADHELNYIIDNINPSTLKDSFIIDAYTNMSKSLSSLELTANERKHSEMLAARERKNAI